MRAELDTFWNDTLVAYKLLVEAPDPHDSTHTDHDRQPGGSP